MIRTRRIRWMLVLGFLMLITPLLILGCDGDSDTGPFVLGECRLNAADCRLQ